jgi:DNA helicase II / ATP-dependent DNA helicase PcrA
MVVGGMIGLTDEQRDAVGCPSNLLLTACPGSGKTRTLIAKLVAEIERVRGSPRLIACITYTNSAVQEIEQRATDQLQPGDNLHYTVSTIHSFCLSEVLRPYCWPLPGFTRTATVLTRDSPDFELIANYAAAQVNYFNLTQGDYEAFESLTLNSDGEIVGFAARNAAVSRAAQHFWRRCAELNYIDFGTIVYNTYLLLRAHPRLAMSLCAKYAWFLVDEFQDTTALQIEILKILFGTGRSLFFAVGDLAQSIYAFTGARPELVEPFGIHIGARMDLPLSGNFRSSSRIVVHAERLFPRRPPMTAVGPDEACEIEPTLIRNVTIFQAITEHYLPTLENYGITLGDATILAKDWASLINLSRQLRDFGTPVVGPGARPYRRSRLFAALAEQLCGAVIDPQPETTRQLERALFHAVRDATGVARTDVFSFEGRVALIRLLKEAKRLSENPGALLWLDLMSRATGEILMRSEYVDRTQAGLFYTSVQEMKADMRRQQVDAANLTIDDLGLFASPTRALRLSTIHYAKGREYKAVALIGLRRGAFPHYRSDDVEAEKRLFYVGVTRARRFLMYIADLDKWANPPSPFLGKEGVGMI